MLAAAMIACGFLLLLAGGEALVRGAVAVAARAGVSPLVIGLTVVAFGTSAPELVVSLGAALAGAPDIAIGNVLGSNIANVALILGVAALIRPIACHPNVIWRDGVAVIAVSLMLLAALLVGDVIGRLQGAGMVVLLAGYVVFTASADRPGPPSDEATTAARLGLPASLALTLGGIGLLVFGADLLVDGAVAIARAVGVSELVIGLTVVAVGTSLPELATSVVAARKGEGDVALGNVLGSNLFNILGILGLTAIVTPVAVDPAVLERDIWMMLATAVVLVPFMATRLTIERWEGAVLLAAYVGYCTLLVG